MQAFPVPLPVAAFDSSLELDAREHLVGRDPEHGREQLARFDKDAATHTKIDLRGLVTLDSAGAWVQPTIWTGLGDDAAIAREEIFGPCTLVMPFDSAS